MTAEDLKQRAPGLIRNTLSLVGAVVALVALDLRDLLNRPRTG